MKNEYIIPFIGLKDGTHQFQYQVDKKFFEDYPYEEILDANLKVLLDFNKQSTYLELVFNLNGTVLLTCDVSSESYDQPIESSLEMLVKFGEEYNDDNIDVLIIPHDSYQLDIAQYLFEMIVLAIPIKRIHPGIMDGTLKTDIINKLKELQPKENINTISSDPRWDKLKDLLTENKHQNGTSKEKNIETKKG